MPEKPQKIQNITLRSVRAAGRKAYRERTLTAQHRFSSRRECVYEDGRYHCVIGTAFSVKTMETVMQRNRNHSTTIGQLVKAGIVTCDRPGKLAHLQEAHDSWCDAARLYGANHSHSVEARNKFKQELGI